MATYNDAFPYGAGPLADNAGWDNAVGVGLNVTGSNTVIALGLDRANLYTGTAFGADQECAADIVSGLGSSDYAIIYARSAGADGTLAGYRASTNGHNYYISRVTAGSGTDLTLNTGGGTEGTFGVDMSDGDKFGIRCVGTTISMLVNDVVVNTATDATYSSGAVGIGTFSTSLTFDNFEAADVGGGGGSTPRNMLLLGVG